MRGSAVALVLLLASPVLAGDHDGLGTPRPRSTDPSTAAVTTAWRNPSLARTRTVVLEAIDRLRALHIDGEGLAPDRMREDAIEALREYAAARSFRLLEGDARERFRRALQHIPDGDLDACLATVDGHLALRTSEQATALQDVLLRGAISTAGDPFTQVIDARAVERLAATMTGQRLPGYGIKVAQGEFGAFTIDHVSRGYDAFDMGIQDGDTIVEVDGHPTVLSSRDDILHRLQGDTRITLRIWREGFTHGHDVTIEAKVPDGPNVDGELLPGGVGYARIESFGEQTPGDLEALLRRLDAKGMRALILDLRDNPGGSMVSCTTVARMFLGPGQVVCRETVREEGVLTTRVCTTEGDAVLSSRTPMIVLVNRGSASASEMLAGALKDHGRARLVGTRTYGKAAGQLPVPLVSAAGERFLLVSVMRYRTPADRSPQGDGLEPDLVVPRFGYFPAEQEELLRLHTGGAFDRYLTDHSVQDEPGLLALADDDAGDLAKYPGFDEWRRGLQTTLDANVVRRALRAAIRGWAARRKAKRFREDLEDDIPLRHAHDLFVAELAPLPAAPKPRRYY
jgi:carboxyl-terminal processing protease